MKKTLSILLLSTILLCCKPQQELSGVWCLTQSIKNAEKTFGSSNKAFFDFSKDSVTIVTIGNPESGDYSKVNILKAPYIYTNSSLTFDVEGKIKFKVTKDSNSIYLSNKILNLDNVEFKQLDTTLKNQFISKDCFNGSYLISSPNYKDSVDFINDSILLYTGEYDINFPAKKWEIINYKGFNILNIQKTFQEITLIKSCSKNKIVLVSPFFNNITLTLTPTSSKIQKTDLFGNWIEVSNSKPQPPLPPGLNPGDELLKLEINSESIKQTIRRRVYKNKWDISNDGKRIYFTDKFNQFRDESFSWKIKALKENEITLKIISSNGFDEEIVCLKKE